MVLPLTVDPIAHVHLTSRSRQKQGQTENTKDR